jgi:F-type H+/Na+-transporting ATPase subunit alpha
MVAVLNQPQYQPWPMEDQVVALWAGNQGYLDEIPVSQIPRFLGELRESLRAEGTVLQTIRETGDLPDEVTSKLEEELKRFKNAFHVAEEKALV